MGLFPPGTGAKNNDEFALPGGVDPVPVTVFKTSHDVLLRGYANCPM